MHASIFDAPVYNYKIILTIGMKICLHDAKLGFFFRLFITISLHLQALVSLIFGFSLFEILLLILF